MKHWCLVVLVACGSASQEPAPSNLAKVPTVQAQRELIAREVAETESGIKHRVWLEHGRDNSLDPNDPCCGLAYDGNKYEDSLASCAIKADHCAPGFQPVYPGIADDKVCGERRRCVPQPFVRFSENGRTGDYSRVTLEREGFIVVASGERVAVDYGGKYTITLRGGRVERVTRD